MTPIERLRMRRNELLAELAALECLRRGSIVQQYVRALKKDGSPVTRGPYPLYSFKDKGKTVSRRLKTPLQVEECRRDIEAFRRFQKVVEQLRVLGEELSDLLRTADRGEKKTPRSSRPKSSGPPR